MIFKSREYIRKRNIRIDPNSYPISQQT